MVTMMHDNSVDVTNTGNKPWLTRIWMFAYIPINVYTSIRAIVFLRNPT